jgi:hypothetical protein
MIIKVTILEEPTLFVDLDEMVIESIREHRRGATFYVKDIIEFKAEDIEYYPEIPDFVEKYVGTWITDQYIWDDNYGSDEKPIMLSRVSKIRKYTHEWVPVVEL